MTIGLFWFPPIVMGVLYLLVFFLGCGISYGLELEQYSALRRYEAMQEAIQAAKEGKMGEDGDKHAVEALTAHLSSAIRSIEARQRQPRGYKKVAAGLSAWMKKLQVHKRKGV
jgi:hypothetical protein